MLEHSTKYKTRMVMWIEDLELLASVFTARFIVWRALRHERAPRGSLERTDKISDRTSQQKAKFFGAARLQ